MATTQNSSPYQVLPIENASFETPTLADGEFTVTVGPDAVSIPGWQAYNPNGLITDTGTDVGAWNPPTEQYPNGVPDGENVGYSYVVDTPGSGVVGLSQTLDTTVAPNTRYTLVVNVGNAAGGDPASGTDYTGFPGYGLEIYFGDVRWDYTYNSVAIPEGQFGTVVLSTVTPDPATLEEYGVSPDDPITIRLVNRNEGPGVEVDFDNVQVVTEPIQGVRFADIENFGFEEPAVADGEFTDTLPPGWELYDPNGLVPEVSTDESSSVGVFNPTVGYYPNQATQGENVGYTFVSAEPGSGPVGLSQTLNEVLTANTHYSLLVDVGNEAESDPNDGNDYTGFPGYRVELLAGDEVVAVDNNTLQIADGSFASAKVDFTVGADNALLGEELTIRLVNLNGGPGLNVDFDNTALYIEEVMDGSQIYIDNAGFEIPVLGEDEFTSSSRLFNPVPGWETYDPDGLLARFGQPDPVTGDNVSVGVANFPTPLVYPNGVPEGNNVAFTYTPNYEDAPVSIGEGVVGLSQTLDTLLAANTTYTLTVDVGNPESYFSEAADFFYNYDGFPGYEVQLLAGGQVIAADHNSLCIAEGEFGTSTVTFTAGSDSSYLGQNLGIRLIDLNAAPGTEVDFDNVQLTAQAAPTHSGCGCWC